MGTCEGCAIGFPKLGSAMCMKCKKLEQTSSDVERLAVENQPQCLSCSVVFPFMKHSICGSCAPVDRELTIPSAMVTSNSASQTKAHVEHILDRTTISQKSASQHRLNQPSKQNANLQAATAKKETLSALKKQSRAEIVFVTASLNAYPIKGAIKKSLILPTQTRWPGETHAKTVIMESSNGLRRNYLDSPVAQREGSMVLNFEQCTYGILKSTKNVYSFNPTEENLVGTIDQLFQSLHRDDKLSDVDYKGRNISLEIYVYEVEMGISEQLNYRSSYASQAPKSTKRKSSGSISSVDPYVSTFRPRKSAVRPEVHTPGLEWDEFVFTKTTYSTDQEGSVSEKIHPGPFEVKIVKGWRKASTGDLPKDGYIAKGLTKYVFEGIFDGKRYAIFQCKPIRVTSSQNLIDLTAELRLLSYGQFFADSFARRAAAYKVDIPAIRWNYAGAFLGSVAKSDIADAPEKDVEDDRSLLFPDFLGTPLLSTNGLYTERKFSGTDQAGDNVDNIGRAIDCFAHHVLIDSKGTFLLTDLQGLVGPDREVILFDPQAHSLAQDTGFWDKGRQAIVEWRNQHKCRTLCMKLKLHDAPLSDFRQESTEPSTRLRIGWPSPNKS